MRGSGWWWHPGGLASPPQPLLCRRERLALAPPPRGNKDACSAHAAPAALPGLSLHRCNATRLSCQRDPCPPPMCDSGTPPLVFSFASYLPLPLTSSCRGFELRAWRAFHGLSGHPSSIIRPPSASGPPPSLHIRKLPAGRSCIAGPFAKPAWSPCQGCLPPGKHLFSASCWEHPVPEA